MKLHFLPQPFKQHSLSCTVLQCVYAVRVHCFAPRRTVTDSTSLEHSALKARAYVLAHALLNTVCQQLASQHDQVS